MRRKTVLAVAFGLLFGMVACEGEATTTSQPDSGSPFLLTASIQDIMVSEIDPAADYLWESIGTVVTPEGTEERRPRTDEEWQAARNRAVILTEATNLLMMEGRLVAEEGKELEDADVPGILTAEQIESALDTNRGAFIAFARALHDVGAATIRAIDARDVDAMMQAGAEMDGVCEGCHIQFWYPNQVIPDFPSDFPSGS
ncbi:MAG TPA: hypothetical protein VFQ22_02075 [Longimicrobiales bacterium]|nr:hypothetical protein [Longimicrobiales bacterium]